MNRLPTLLVLGVLLAVPLTMVEPAQSSLVYMPGPRMYVGQEFLRPGDDLSVTLHSTSGHSGELRLNSISPQEWLTDRHSSGRLTATQSFTGTADNGPLAVAFESVPAGLYRVEAWVDDEVVGRQWVQVSDVAVLGRVAGDDAVLWAVHLDTGRGVPGFIWSSHGRNTTGPDGLWTGPAPDGEVAVATSFGPAFLYGNRGRAAPSDTGAIYTDRPLYRPDQAVHVKVVAWDEDAPAAGQVQVTVSTWHRGKESVVARQALDLGSYGTAAMDLQLPADAALGSYSIKANLNGRTLFGGFRVEEYRLPEFRIELAAPSDTVVVGEPLEVLVHASRFYGEPIDEGEVRFEAMHRPTYCHWSCYGGTHSDAATQSGTQTASQVGTTQLMPDGTARIRVVPDAPGSYDLRVRVTGVQGETIEEHLSFSAHEAATRLHIALTTWNIAADATMPVPVEVMDLHGRPLDTQINLTVYEEEWKENGYERTFLQQSSAVASAGAAGFEVRTPPSGRLVLRAEAVDAEGRTVAAERILHVGGGPALADRLEISPATESVGAGEPVEVLIRSDTARPALVTLEADGLHGVQVVDLAATGKVSFSSQTLTGRQAMAVVTQLRGGYASQDRVTITLDPAPRELRVEVRPDRDIYEDGEAARILVQVTDAAGEPVQAEVSLAMVDEALLALPGQRQDVVALLLPTPRGGVAMGSLHGGGYGGVYGMGSGGGQTMKVTDASMPDTRQAPAVKVREYFPETALWLPQAETDANGTLRVLAHLPDTLTTWQLVAVAVSKDGKAGEGAASLVTRKDLVADLFAPRFLINGDEAIVQATVSNHMGRQRDVLVLIEAQGVELDTPASRTLSLAPGRTGLVSYAIAADQAGQANLTFYAWSPEDERGDAVRMRFPVHPHGTMSGSSWGGKGPAEIHVRIPEAIDGEAVLTVGLSRTSGDAIVDALPGLVQYPYGCVEQTLSRFLPAIAVAQAADSFGLDRDEVAPELEAVVAAGLDKLYGYQHGTGAWGWWTDDPDNPYTTAYVVYGLAVARDAGFDIDAHVLNRGVAALAGMAAQEQGSSLGAYQRYALSVAAPSLVPDLPNGSGPAVAAMGLMTADALGKNAAAQGYLDQLVSAAVESGGEVHWHESGTGWTSHGISSDTMLTALAIRALAPHDHEFVEPAIEWLLGDREGLSWRTTKDTAETILTLAAIMAPAPDEVAATVLVGGQEQDVVIRGAGVKPLRFDLPPGDHTLTIETSSTLYWTARSAYFASSEPITAAGDFTFERIVRDTHGKEVSQLRVGEEGTVEVTVTGPRSTQYVMIEDMLPAGVEVLPEDGCSWCSRWSHREVRDDRVGFFATEMTEEQVFSYRIRAVWAGTYHVMPARAEEMYDPDTRGHGDESQFTVVPQPALQVGRVAVSEGRIQANLHPVGELPGTAHVDVIVDGATTSLNMVQPGDGVWHLDLDVPGAGANSTVQVVVRAGDAVAEAVVDPALRQVAGKDGFDQEHEGAWVNGSALAAGSSADSLPVDYAAVFAGATADVFGDPIVPGPGQKVPVMWWTWLVLVAIAWRRR